MSQRPRRRAEYRVVTTLAGGQVPIVHGPFDTKAEALDRAREERRLHGVERVVVERFVTTSRVVKKLLPIVKHRRPDRRMLIPPAAPVMRRVAG